MAKIEEIKRAAQNAAYTATEKAQGMAAVAGEKANAVKEVAKTNISLVTEKRNLEKAYQALGEWYAAQLGEDVPEGAENLVAAIRLTQQNLETLKNLKSEQDMSARELLDRGVEFFSEKAEALVSLAKKGRSKDAQEPVEESAAPAEEPAVPAAETEPVAEEKAEEPTAEPAAESAEVNAEE